VLKDTQKLLVFGHFQTKKMKFEFSFVKGGLVGNIAECRDGKWCRNGGG